MKIDLFDGFKSNILSFFTWRNLIWLIVVIILTAISVNAGFDWWWFAFFSGGNTYSLTFPAVFIGGFLPMLLPLVLIAYGLIRDRKVQLIGSALGQAAILGYLFSIVLKAFTGRIPPPRHITSMASDISHGFQLGFMRGGIFWGWPSSHAMVSTALAACAIALFPQNKVMKIVAVAYALYIALGVSMSIHWFSEALAGIMLGAIIGWTVGKSFHRRLSKI